MFTRQAKSLVVLGALLLFIAAPVMAQRTPLRPGFNVFSPQQDVELGRALAEETRGILTFSRDSYTHGYINALGNQLAGHAPGFKYPYEFEVFLDPSINAYGFPGGVVYVSSGMVAAAQTEAELAMMLAHEIGHVVARHASHQLSGDYTDRTNSRTRPSVEDAYAALDVRFRPNSDLWRYTEEQEQDADVIATQILFDARFDPRQLPPAFQRMDSLAGSRGGQYFANHPAPLNRLALVRKELQGLGRLSANLRADSPDLHTTQRNLRNEGLSSREGRGNNIRGNDIGSANSNTGVPLPSTRMTAYQGWEFEFNHPDNWAVSESGDSVTVAPRGGIVSGSLAWGMTAAKFRPQGRGGFFGQNSFNLPGGGRSTGSTTLSAATDQLINDLRRSNPGMQVISTDQRRINGEAALVTELSSDSPLGGREIDRLYTVLRSDGMLQYFLGVVPQRDAGRYAVVFDQIINTVRLPRR